MSLSLVPRENLPAWPAAGTVKSGSLAEQFLILRRRWAEYLTIITTGGLLPLEVYEINKHITWIKIGVLLVNIAIVVYLVARVRRKA